MAFNSQLAGAISGGFTGGYNDQIKFLAETRRVFQRRSLWRGMTVAISMAAKGKSLDRRPTLRFSEPLASLRNNVRLDPWIVELELLNRARVTAVPLADKDSFRILQ